MSLRVRRKKDYLKRSEREERILSLLPTVKSLAISKYQEVPDSICLDDLINAGALAAIKAVDRYKEGSEAKLRSFAYCGIKGAIIDELRGSAPFFMRKGRAKDKVKILPLDNLVKDNDNNYSSNFVSFKDRLVDDSLHETIEKREAFRLLHKAVDNLPEPYRKIIKLYYFSEKTQQEIGEKLGKSHAWISRLRKTALMVLRKQLCYLQ